MATSVIKPNNAGVDLPISLPTTGWSSNQWTYSNSAITADCAIEVEFKDGTLNDDVPYIEYEKVSGGGGIVFTVPSVPTVAIPVVAHVYFTQNGSFTTAVDTAITTTGSVESLGANVNAALDSLNSKIPTSNVFDEILIPAGSDLNNYRTPGTFIVPNDSVASQISNMPYSASGRLIVMNRTTSSYMVQEYYTTSSAPTKMIRNYNNGTWTSWDRVALSNKNTYSITLSSGWSAGTCEVVNIGKVCILQVNQLKTTTTSSGWKQAGTLDANVQPSGRIWGYFACDTSLSAGKASVAEVRVNTDRTVEVYAPQANEAYWGGFAYFCY